MERRQPSVERSEQDTLPAPDAQQESCGAVPSPPSTPPSPNANGNGSGNESKISRKREREVSLEPTPQTTALEIGVEREHKEKDRSTPAKKNRISVHLDAAQEADEDRAQLAASGSPPHESKIRQISRGVEDITWKNTKENKDNDADVDHSMADAPRPVHIEGQDAIVEPAQGQEPDSDGDAAMPPLKSDENAPVVQDTVEKEENSGETDPAEVSSDARKSATPEKEQEIAESIMPDEPDVSKSQETVAVVPSVAPQAIDKRDFDPDVDSDKGLKRKLADRAVSEQRVLGEPVSGQKEQEATGRPQTGLLKRLRDDPDTDANPRETKRPTPPPDEDEDLKKDKPSASTSVPSTRQRENTASSATSTSNATVSSTPSSTASTPKLVGFAAYASAKSPFASVIGPNIFSKSPSPSAWASASASTSTSAHPSPALTTSPFTSGAPSPAKENKTKPTSAFKRTGFEAFASVASPFASVKRPNSPPPGSVFGTLSRSRSPSRPGELRGTNAFSAYASGGAKSFASRGAVFGESSSTVTGLGILDRDDDAEESGREDGAVSFGDRLRAEKDEEEVSEEETVALTEREVITGEEDEECVYQVRGKLFSLSDQNQWKERGTGTLRLNVRRDDGTGARLVMRKEAVYTVLLNTTLFKGMRCFLAQDPRYLRFSVFEGAATTHYNLRVSSAKIAEELLDEITARIPRD